MYAFEQDNIMSVPSIVNDAVIIVDKAISSAFRV